MAEELWKDCITDKNKSEMRMVLFDILMVDFKSADSGDEGLRGAGLDILVVDEASRVSEVSWTNSLRPSLSDKLGVGMFISTPNGQNWFYNLYLKGQTDNADYQSWKFESRDNPHFPASEWIEAQKDLPQDVFSQEYKADFLEESASVFRGIDKIKYTLQNELKVQKGYRYSIGVDLAKVTDFTVISVFDEYTNRQVEMDRFNEISWNIQKQRIFAMAQKYNNATVTIDATGLGDPIVEDLIKHKMNVDPFKFTNSSKKELIEKLIISIEQGLIQILDNKEQIAELRAFTYEITPSRNIRYTAPTGLHDDCVMALALSIWNVDIYNKTLPQEVKNTYYRSKVNYNNAMAG